MTPDGPSRQKFGKPTRLLKVTTRSTGASRHEKSVTLINISFITITAMVAKKKVSFEDFAPSKPLLGKAGELYPADCLLWTQRPDEDIVHDLNAAHNKATKKFLKGAKQKASDPEGANVNAERDVFIALPQFIAFGTTPAGSPIYPRLIDLEKTPKDQASAVNAVIAFMQAHFPGVNAQVLRTQVVGK